MWSSINISAPCVNAVLIPPAALVSTMRGTPQRTIALTPKTARETWWPSYRWARPASAATRAPDACVPTTSLPA